MRTHRLVTCGFVTGLLCVTSLTLHIAAQTAAKDREAQSALQAALNKEFIDGDSKAAIQQYLKIIADYRDSHTVAARALVRLGQAYAKTGNPEAQKTYERVRRDYPEQLRL